MAGRLRLWVLSDLRIDLDPILALPDPLPAFDALVVAGNVGRGLSASLRWISDALGGRQGSRSVVFVPGNVEYWSELPLVEATARGRDVASSLGIHLLADDTVRISNPDGSGLQVVGATLWSDWALDGTFEGRLARVAAKHAWPDGDRIQLRRGRPWTPLDSLGVHARSRAYIEDALATIAYQSLGFPTPPRALVEGVRPGDRAIVVTCHAPSRRSLPEPWYGWHSDAWLRASLASDLEAIATGRDAPALWIHGNAPRTLDYVVGRTRIVSNPRLHARASTGFDPALVVLA